jgi:hypothetical protein
MRHAKPASKQRLKLILMAVGMAALGALLIFLYVKIQPSPEQLTGTAVTPPTTTAPATAPASAPSPTSAPASSHRPAPIDPKAASARNMSAMFLLFGLMSITVSGACVLLIILDIRKSRPAWKTQTKYPRRR